METNEVLLQIQNLDVTFGSGKNAFRAVQNVSFDIRRGEILGLVGESGSGKTTIANAIMRLVPVSGGEILCRGQRINGKISRAAERMIIQQIQMVFQDPSLSVNSRAKVNDIIREGLQNIRPDLSRAQQNDMVAQVLTDVGLRPDHANQFPYSLSGGQLQRVGIARAIIMEPSLIIADEPVSALDVSVRAQILHLMMELRKKRDLTYLFISHDLSIMRMICDRIAVIRSGRIVELADTPRIYANPLHPYTQALLSAIPIPNPELERNRIYHSCPEQTHSGSCHWVEAEERHFVLREDAN